MLREIFIKYLNNQCSPAEVAELFAYFNVPENEKVLRELIIESLEKIDPNNDWEGLNLNITQKTNN